MDRAKDRVVGCPELTTSVGLHVPAVGLFKLSTQLGPIVALRRRRRGHRLIDAGLHSPQAAHVDVGFGVFDPSKDFRAVLSHAVLDIHPAAAGVLLFAADRFCIAEVIGKGCKITLPFIFVEQVWGGGDPHDQPGLTPELIGGVLRPLARIKHPAEVGPHRGNTRTSGQHNHVGLLIGRQKHFLPHRAGDLYLSSRLDVAQEGGADAIDGLAVLLILQLTHTQGEGLVCEVVAVAGTGD